MLADLARLEIQPGTSLNSLPFSRAHPERLPPLTTYLMDWRVLGASKRILASNDAGTLGALAIYASAGQQGEEWRDIVLKIADGTPAREQALICLGWHGDPRNLKFLGDELLKDDDKVANIAYNLARNYGKEGEDYVRRGLEKSPNMRVKFECAQQLMLMGKPEGFRFYLDNLDWNNGRMRSQIYQEMRDWVVGGRNLKERDLASFLEAHANGKVKDDGRWKAIRRIGESRDRSKIPVLLKSLSDPDSNVRACAARALCDMEVREAAKPIIEMLSHETEGGVIEQSTLLISKFKVKEALPVLRKLANHRDPQTRNWVLQAIGELGSKDDIACVASYLAATDIVLRSIAAEILGKMTRQDFGVRRQGPLDGREIERAAKWWDQHKGEYPVCSWGLSGEERSQAAFLASIRRPDKPLDSDEIKRLLQLIDSDDREVRYSVMDALRHARRPESIPTFIRLLDDYDHHIQYAAMMSLCEMNSPGGAGCPSIMLYDKDPDKYKAYWKSWWQQKKKMQ